MTTDLSGRLGSGARTASGWMGNWWDRVTWNAGEKWREVEKVEKSGEKWTVVAN